ncbi:MAG: hypothetical protein ACI837_000339 [Crocinitomicaceae bacterium]|jgi:hypothetical protein
MKVGIMQPYFFPNLGHFALINEVDKWIVFDGVQFIRHGWIERNRILKPSEGVQYISVPLVKSGRDTLIRDTKIRSYEPWKDKLLSQLNHYKKRAPHYRKVVQFLEKSFEFETDSIVDLNMHLLRATCDHLSIQFDAEIYSRMNLDHPEVHEPGDWALEISKAVKATNYINPIGGKELFDSEKYAKNGVRINFLEFQPTAYPQKGNQFESGLSIIDVMLFNSIDEIKEMLLKFELT